MLNMIKSEFLKQKKSQGRKMLVVIPFLCMLLGMMFMGFVYVQQSSYNWWYITFLPFMTVYHASALIHSEKKYNYHGLFSIVIDKKQIWLAKIIEGLLYVLVANLIFVVFNVFFGTFGGMKISVINSLLAAIILFLTMIWQIPFFMYLCKKTNLFLTVFIGIVVNIIAASALAPTRFWWIPFSISARLMCPIVKMFPNGLLIPKNHSLLSTSCILPGIGISVFLFILFSFGTMKLFEHQEVA